MKRFKVAAPNLASSKVMEYIADNVKMTTKKGGSVQVVTNGKAALSVGILIKDGAINYKIFPNEADEKHRFQGAFSAAKHKWMKVFGDGVGTPSGKNISDDEALKLVQAIFEKAKSF